MELYADAVAGLDPDEGEIESAEVVVSDDVLVKAFVLGPGAELEAHEHADSTNVFHVLEGTVTVVREELEATVERSVEAPGVVHHERGDVHGARNETDERAAFTASLCPMPGSG
jgi:quercetin dioxygenase-like cupin family protein